MKVVLVLLLVAAVGYFSWRINKKQRAKYAERKTLHKATIKPKPAKSQADIALEKEMERMKKAMNDADMIFRDYDSSKIKKFKK